MASPQKENGYTAVANEIMDALARIRINGVAWQVLNVVLRKTYGWNKKEDAIALSQFCEATGLKKPTVCKALNHLISMKVVTNNGNGVAKTYMLQKDFDKWVALPKKVTLPIKVKGVTNKGKRALALLGTTKARTKATITKATTAQGAEGTGFVISLFKEINPSYGILYNRKPQHEAVKRLLAREPIERIKGAIGFVAAHRSDRFCPRISTPIQLEEKWAQLENYGASLKVTNLNKRGVIL